MTIQTKPDRGTDGEAMTARPWSMATIEDDTAAEDGSAQFTRTEVLRYQDTVVDMCASKGVLVGFSVDAAVQLARLYHDGRNANCGYRVSGQHGGGEMSDERAEAWALYCEALDNVPIRCAETCSDVARGKWPTRLNAVDEMQVGFAALVQYWRLGPRQPD